MKGDNSQSKINRCECGNEQWEWWWALNKSPTVYCEICGTKYDFDNILDVYLQKIQKRGNAMKRDANLIRVILLSVEGDGAEISSEDNKETVNYHLRLMIEGGLLNGKEINEGQWQVYGLTWEGCELLELIRDHNRWQIIKRILNDLNCYSFEIIRQIAIQQLKL